MNYRIKYAYELDVIHPNDYTLELAISHFKQRGFEYLYLQTSDRLIDYITCHDLPLKNFNNIKKHPFSVQEFNNKIDPNEIENIFQQHPDVERIIYLKNNKIYCEVDPMVEPALQNGVCKALMSLRYIKFWKHQIENYLKKFKYILIISDDITFSFIKKIFPELHLNNSDTLNIIYNTQADLILDFLYGKKLRKAVGITNPNVYEFNKIVEFIALHELKEYSMLHNINLKFYRLPQYHQLNCLHQLEFEHYKNKTRIVELALDENYVKLFSYNKSDYDFVKERKFNKSLRLDNWFFYTQEDCSSKEINVANGIRKTVGTLKSDNSNINFYGPCTTFGIMVPDDETVPSCLQSLLNSNNINFSCMNYGGLHGNNVLNSIISALATPVKEGDYFVFLDVLDDFPDSSYHNLISTNEWFDSKKSKNEIYFFDFPGHCNFLANQLLAQGIFNDILSEITPSFRGSRFDYFSLNNYCIFKASEQIITSPNIKKLYSSIKPINSKDVYSIGAYSILDFDSDKFVLDDLNLIASRCDYIYFFITTEFFSYDSQYQLYDKIHCHINKFKNIYLVNLDHLLSPLRLVDFKNNKIKSVSSLYKCEEVFCASILKRLSVTVRFFKEYDMYDIRSNIVSIGKYVTEKCDIETKYLLDE